MTAKPKDALEYDKLRFEVREKRLVPWQFGATVIGVLIAVVAFLYQIPKMVAEAEEAKAKAKEADARVALVEAGKKDAERRAAEQEKKAADTNKQLIDAEKRASTADTLRGQLDREVARSGALEQQVLEIQRVSDAAQIEVRDLRFKSLEIAAIERDRADAAIRQQMETQKNLETAFQELGFVQKKYSEQLEQTSAVRERLLKLLPALQAKVERDPELKAATEALFRIVNAL